MAKGAEAFRSIGEVAKLIGVAPHVLRYWETQFGLLKPMKRGDGRRYYRPDDVRLAAGLCEVLRDEGLTIRGAKKLLAKDRGESVRARGAVKLGEMLESELLELDEPAAAAPAATSSRAPVPSQDAASLSEQDEPARVLRSRNRKRPALRDPGPLPLFPEDAAAPAAVAAAGAGPVDAAQAGWLAELTRTTLALRAHPGGPHLSGRARAEALRLLDAIADHY